MNPAPFFVTMIVFGLGAVIMEFVCTRLKYTARNSALSEWEINLIAFAHALRLGLILAFSVCLLSLSLISMILNLPGTI